MGVPFVERDPDGVGCKSCAKIRDDSATPAGVGVDVAPLTPGLLTRGYFRRPHPGSALNPNQDLFAVEKEHRQS